MTSDRRRRSVSVGLSCSRRLSSLKQTIAGLHTDEVLLRPASSEPHALWQLPATMRIALLFAQIVDRVESNDCFRPRKACSPQSASARRPTARRWLSPVTSLCSSSVQQKFRLPWKRKKMQPTRLAGRVVAQGLSRRERLRLVRPRAGNRPSQAGAVPSAVGNSAPPVRSSGRWYWQPCRVRPVSRQFVCSADRQLWLQAPSRYQMCNLRTRSCASSVPSSQIQPAPGPENLTSQKGPGHLVVRF